MWSVTKLHIRLASWNYLGYILITWLHILISKGTPMPAQALFEVSEALHGYRNPRGVTKQPGDIFLTPYISAQGSCPNCPALVTLPRDMSIWISSQNVRHSWTAIISNLEHQLSIRIHEQDRKLPLLYIKLCYYLGKYNCFGCFKKVPTCLLGSLSKVAVLNWYKCSSHCTKVESVDME